jgi:hypothetical protein
MYISNTNSVIENSSGGRTTISPPSKINQKSKQEINILASNIDTLRLSIDIKWKDSYFFSALTEAKLLAKADKIDFPIPFIINNENDEYFFNVKYHGSQGYEWILNNPEYSLLIGNWVTPQSRPSVMVTIRSETLWRKGPRKAVYFITSLIEKLGGEITEVKISRVDLCVDALFPEKLWNENILGHRVTRATDTKTFHSNKKLTGFMIGKGSISARLYDKPLEIQQQSNKTWFFDVWGLKEVPNNYKIIRVEFQLRREAVKQLGIPHVHNLFDLIQNVWSYCTKDWLKFQDNPGKQSHQRKTLKWWGIIQDGFNNIPAGSSLIRNKAIKADQDRLSQQIIGLMSSFAALELERGYQLDSKNINLISVFQAFQRHSIKNNLLDIEFSERVENKKAKYQRIKDEDLNSINPEVTNNFLPNDIH